MDSKSKFAFLLFLVKWTLIISFGLAFFPIIVLIFVGWLIIKKVKNKKVKTILLTVIVIPFFLVTAGIIYAIQHTSLKPVSKPAPTPGVFESGVIQTSIPQVTSNIEMVKVSRVIDGDTLEIEGGKKIRLIGIDTPELNKSGTTGCFGREAYDYANKLLAGQTIKLEKDISETDRYGRLLRFIYLGDIFINDKLVKDGYARDYTYPPDVKYQNIFKESEIYARENNLGLWDKCKSVTAIPSISPASSIVKQTTSPKANSNTSIGGYSCDCSKSCSEISSCSEAQYQLKICGCSKRDGDGDGLACDGAPLNCQN